MKIPPAPCSTYKLSSMQQDCKARPLSGPCIGDRPTGGVSIEEEQSSSGLVDISGSCFVAVEVDLQFRALEWVQQLVTRTPITR